MSWQWVDSDAALATALTAMADATVLAIDTEFMRQSTFFPEVALLQVCTGDLAYLIDPLSISDTSPIAALLADTSRTKILHSASEDLEVFQHWLGVMPDPLFDTQRAMGLLGLGFGMGYQGMIESLLGVSVDKGETRSNWLARPLTDAQCSYAAQDVTYLLQAFELLQQRARDNERYEWVVDDGAAAVAAMRDNSGPDIARVKSAGQLGQRSLAALAGILSWREQVARDRNRPRNWIVDEKACVAIARALPDSQTRLSRVEDLPAAVVKRYGGALLQAVDSAQQVAASELPQALPAPLAANQRQQLKKLKQAGREIASALGMSPEALLPGRDYELLLREAAGQTIREPAIWQGWRRASAIEPLRAQLREGST